jgi:hypothetical protein
MGFAAIYISSCDNETDIRVTKFDDTLDLDHYLNPISLIFCYFVIAITSRVVLGPQVNFISSFLDFLCPKMYLAKAHSHPHINLIVVLKIY